MSKLVETNEKIAEAVVEGYKKIENGVVEGYKKIETGAVEGFNKVLLPVGIGALLVAGAVILLILFLRRQR